MARNFDGYFDLWLADVDSIIETMYKNMEADREAGYHFNGASLTRQRQEIAERQADRANKLELFKTMTERDVNRWCFYDLVKRGAIEV